MTSMKIAQFSRYPIPCPCTSKILPTLELGCPISSKPPLSKCYRACERTKAKPSHITFKLTTRLLFDLAHKQCNGIIKG